MMRILFTILLSLFLVSGVTITSLAQSKKILLEARSGMNDYGVSGRYFINNTSAIDAIVGINKGNSGITFTTMYEEHYPVKNVTGLSWYAGAGLHTSYQFAVKEEAVDNTSDAVPKNENGGASSSSSFSNFGADAIIGMRYKLGKSPISVATDLKPFVNFMNKEAVFFTGNVRVGISL